MRSLCLHIPQEVVNAGDRSRTDPSLYETLDFDFGASPKMGNDLNWCAQINDVSL